MTASILKAKGIPCRVRAGYAPYFPDTNGQSVDHWINEYWDSKAKHWVIIDVDGSLHDTGYDMLDLPKDAFDFPGPAWLQIRSNKISGSHFWNAGGAKGMQVVGWALFYDFHSLMNNEIIYMHNPAYLGPRWNNLTEKNNVELDNLAKLLTEPDKNFTELKRIWETEKKFRILRGALL